MTHLILAIIRETGPCEVSNWFPRPHISLMWLESGMKIVYIPECRLIPYATFHRNFIVSVFYQLCISLLPAMRGTKTKILKRCLCSSSVCPLAYKYPLMEATVRKRRSTFLKPSLQKFDEMRGPECVQCHKENYQNKVLVTL